MMNDSGDLTPVARSTLFQEAADAIRAALLRGSFRPGDRLEEPNLARSLNLSRGPVREALRQLEHEGLVTVRPHRGARVIDLTKAEIGELLSIRGYLETFNCAATVDRVTEVDLVNLRDLVDRMEEAVRAGEPVALGLADVSFHRGLVVIGSTSAAVRMWESLMSPLGLYITLSNAAYLEQVGDVAATHAPILEALDKRNADQLQVVLLAHIDETRSIFEASEEGTPTRPEIASR